MALLLPLILGIDKINNMKKLLIYAVILLLGSAIWACNRQEKKEKVDKEIRIEKKGDDVTITMEVNKDGKKSTIVLRGDEAREFLEEHETGDNSFTFSDGDEIILSSSNQSGKNVVKIVKKDDENESVEVDENPLNVNSKIENNSLIIDLSLNPDEEAEVKVKDPEGNEIYSETLEGEEEQEIIIQNIEPEKGAYEIRVRQGNKVLKSSIKKN